MNFKKLFFAGALAILPLLSFAQFDKYFHNKTLRYDFYHCGNANSESYFFDELIEEPYWGGSKKSLIDEHGYGVQLFKIIDKKSKKLIYQRTYNTLFNEWQTTDEAQKVEKGMPESIVFPFPKQDVVLEIYSRDKKGVFQKKHTQDISVDSYFIRKSIPSLESFEVHYTGNPDQRIDIVLVPEGYSENEKEKFEKAAKEFASEFFSFAPYSDYKEKFNIRAVWAPSKESGVTIPGENNWKTTATKAQYYTFDSERYQMIEDFQCLRDIAANVPYDYIYVLSNTQKYGGGGIYNFYGISAANHPTRTGKIYVHEFGHLLLGLADEYVGNVSYNEMYPLDVEPWEPNVTTLVNFERKQWKKMLAKETTVPTAASEENCSLLGVYEGAGYVEKGVYRPWVNCMMNNIHKTEEFCPVCTWAISDYIDFLCK